MTTTIYSTAGEAVDVEVMGAFVRIDDTLLNLDAARELIEALVAAVNEAAIHAAAVALGQRT